MEQEQLIAFQDETNDRNYFTIIPNYILNHSTATAQALYLQLKRLAGERNTAYPASRYLKEKLGISHNTLSKELNYLLEKGWIKQIGYKSVNTDGGIQKVKEYKIVDLWQLNNDYYKGGIKIGTPKQRGVKIEPQGVSTRGVKIGAKEEPLEEEPSLNKNITETPGVSGKEIAEVISLFKDVNPSSYGKWYNNTTQREAISRLLEKFPIDQLARAIAVLPQTNQQKYAPVITTPLQLEDKMASLKAFIQKSKPTKQPIIL